MSDDKTTRADMSAPSRCSPAAKQAGDAAHPGRSTDAPACVHDYGGSRWVKHGIGWAVEEHCSRCGHREYSHYVGVM